MHYFTYGIKRLNNISYHVVEASSVLASIVTFKIRVVCHFCAILIICPITVVYGGKGKDIHLMCVLTFFDVSTTKIKNKDVTSDVCINML